MFFYVDSPLTYFKMFCMCGYIGCGSSSLSCKDVESSRGTGKGSITETSGVQIGNRTKDCRVLLKRTKTRSLHQSQNIDVQDVGV